MADKFENFAALAKVYTEGKDFLVEALEVDNKFICIVAPHAGKIESQTGEICAAIAAEKYSSYIFSGCLKDNNKDLHITSHNFDEPSARPLLSKHDTALGVHRRKDKAMLSGIEVTDGETIFIGGLDEEFKRLLAESLIHDGFKVEEAGHDFPAKNPENVCNIGTSRKGAQIELPKKLRDKISNDTAVFDRIISALRSAISKHELNSTR